MDTDWISKYIGDFDKVYDELIKSYLNQIMNNLGVNIYQEQITIPKYLVKQELDIEFTNHLKSNAVHVIKQPHYYRNMFTILN